MSGVSKPANQRDPETFGQVLDRFLKDPDIPKWRFFSTKRTFRDISKQIDLKQAPATLESYRDIVEKFNPKPAGVRPRRWISMKCDLRFLLRYAGVLHVPMRSTTPLTYEWESLLKRLSSNPRKALGRFARFCSESRISPGEVTDEVADEFREIVRRESVARKPRHTHRTMLTHWNRAAETRDGWPRIQLSVEPDSRIWALPLTAYPISFREEVDAWQEWLATDDQFSERAPRRSTKPKARMTKKHAIRYMAGALVVQGRDPDTMTSLKDLVEPEACKSALRYIVNRRSDGNLVATYNIALVMRSIAEDWLRLDNDAVDAVQFLCRRLRLPPYHVSDMTCRRLRQLDDHDNLKRFLRFPLEQMEQVRARDSGRPLDALRVQVALAVELLIMAPVLISELVKVDLRKDIDWKPDGRSIVTIPRGGSNDCRKFELPEQSTELLSSYLSDYRPRLTIPSNRWLFPGNGDRSKYPQSLARRIKQAVRDETGMVINSRLFRSIAAKLYLDANPGSYEVVRRLMGHRSLKATMAMYTGAELVVAAGRYDEEILGSKT